MPFAAAAAIGAVGSIAGGLIQGSASKSAASQQSAADQHAADLQKQMFDTSQANLAPYNQYGQNNLGAASDFYKVTADQAGHAWDRAQVAIPQGMTEENLINTPGYQFNLSQGMRAVQNSAAAKGLGVSGAALQGAAQYATGLADSTYQNQFNNQQTQYQDALSQFNAKNNSLNTIFGQLTAPISLGENAAASQGNNAITSGQNIGNSLIQGGIAQSAGTTGQAAGYSNALQGVGNAGALAYLGSQGALGGQQSYLDNGSF